MFAGQVLAFDEAEQIPVWRDDCRFDHFVETTCYSIWPQPSYCGHYLVFARDDLRVISDTTRSSFSERSLVSSFIRDVATHEWLSGSVRVII